MNTNQTLKYIVYTFCIYILYLYTAETLISYHSKLRFPTSPYAFYFDITLFLFGGIVFGITLFRMGKKFHKALGVIMITANVVLIPLLLLRELN